jgi:hypothetical protein
MDEFKEGYRRWVPEGLESLGEKGHRGKSIT